MSIVRLRLLAAADDGDLEPDLPQLLRVDDQTAVKDERRLVHVLVHLLPGDRLELLPLGGDHDRFRVLSGLEGRREEGDLLLD